MPPKSKVTKEEILRAALETVRESGLSALNARAIAARLGCSTQPVFSNYASMEELKADVMREAFMLYQAKEDAAKLRTDIPAYKAMGLAYVNFAREEKELFRLLFMTPRASELPESKQSFRQTAKLAGESAALPPTEAERFHAEMWVFVHGVAAMLATDYLEWDEETVSQMMTDVYLGAKLREAQHERD